MSQIANRFAPLLAGAMVLVSPNALAAINLDLSVNFSLPVVKDLAGRPLQVFVVRDADREPMPFVYDCHGRRVFFRVLRDREGQVIPLVYDPFGRYSPRVAVGWEERICRPPVREVIVEPSEMRYEEPYGHAFGHRHHGHRRFHREDD